MCCIVLCCVVLRCLILFCLVLWFACGLLLVWFGMVWFGLVWFGLVWFGSVWFGLVWFGYILFGIIWCVFHFASFSVGLVKFSSVLACFVSIGPCSRENIISWTLRPFLTQSDLSVENGLFRLKPKSAFLTQSKKGFIDSTFFDRVFRLEDPVEKLSRKSLHLFF